MTIEQNIDNCWFNGKTDSTVIDDIEEKLGINIPRNYRDFIENYGSGNINGFLLKSKRTGKSHLVSKIKMDSLKNIQ